MREQLPLHTEESMIVPHKDNSMDFNTAPKGITPKYSPQSIDRAGLVRILDDFKVDLLKAIGKMIDEKLNTATNKKG